jgi:hypothetical protein
MNRITNPGRRPRGFLWRVQDPEEGQGRSDTERAIESGQETTEQLAGRPKDPDL